MLALERQDIDIKRGVMTVRQSDWRDHVTTPKGNRTRKVPMTKKLQAALKANLHLKSDRVLCREGGEPATAESVKWWMEAVERRAKLEVAGKVHVLRHTFCGHLAMKGANAITIKELAGHRQLSRNHHEVHAPVSQPQDHCDCPVR
jgi:site-specific recombinase XerD